MRDPRRKRSRLAPGPSVAPLVLFATLVALPAASEPIYRDVTARTGIEFVQQNGATGTKQYCEVMGSGGCLLDYDGDGRLDLYLVTSVGANRLYRNLGGLKFEDVTERAGVGDEGYGMGAVAADVDGDGDADLHVTNFGPNRLFVNQGDGTFRENGAAAGVADTLWGCGASFLDHDRDGDLDLYLANYVHQARPDTAECIAQRKGLRLYCPPRDYDGAQDRFFRNRGDGTFEDATESAGILGHVGRGLGVVASDVDQDGWPDLYVANDLNANFLFHNRGDGTFEDDGMFAGVSHSEDGMEQGGMGVAAADYDNDGLIDLFVANYLNEVNSLYHNEGGGFFLDESATSGLGPQSLPYIGWGTAFLDFDRDGWKDLFVANGHTESDAEKVDPTTTWKQPDFLYRNRGDGTFEDVTGSAAPALLEPSAGRGTIFGDLDDDGDVDLVIVNQLDRPRVLENTGNENHWIGFRLRGTKSNRDAVGARVDLWAGDLRAVGEVQAGGSYLAGNDPRILLGLAARTAVDSVVVSWPAGGTQKIVGPAVDAYLEIGEE